MRNREDIVKIFDEVDNEQMTDVKTDAKNEKVLTSVLTASGIPDAEKKAALMLAYMKLVLKRNEVMNLTAITDEDEFIAKHLLDSLAVLGHSELEAANRVADVGTGAGFPGVPLAIAYPDKDFLLIDSLRKRTDFISEACAELSIDNVQALHARAEDAARIEEINSKNTKGQPSRAANPNNYSPKRTAKRTAIAESASSSCHPTRRENFDLALCRAVGPLAVLCEYCLPLVRVGGAVYAYKSESQSEETRESAKALSILGAAPEVKIISTNDFFKSTPSDRTKGPNVASDLRHIIIVIKKERPTPDTYPRRPGVPAKSPL
jgi:16S rRNA (guanine527-N7)-methyltransferase